MPYVIHTPPPLEGGGGKEPIGPPGDLKSHFSNMFSGLEFGYEKSHEYFRGCGGVKTGSGDPLRTLWAPPWPPWVPRPLKHGTPPTGPDRCWAGSGQSAPGTPRWPPLPFSVQNPLKPLWCFRHVDIGHSQKTEWS